MRMIHLRMVPKAGERNLSGGVRSYKLNKRGED